MHQRAFLHLTRLDKVVDVVGSAAAIGLLLSILYFFMCT